MWEKEKLLVTSNFFFPHIIFKRHVLQTRKNQHFFGKELINWIVYSKGKIISPASTDQSNFESDILSRHCYELSISDSNSTINLTVFAKASRLVKDIYLPKI